MLTSAVANQFQGPLNADDGDAIAACRELLLAHGFAGDAVLSALGRDAASWQVPPPRR